MYLSEPLRKIGDYADKIEASGTTGTVTRRIKKLALTGQETIGSYQSIFYIQLPSDAKSESNAPICTHFLGTKETTLENYCIRQMVTGYWGGQLPALQLKDSSHDSVTNLKGFFATQYTAGTPVTVWYVLATAQTETVTAPTITPTSGSNTFSVGTTLQPSEVSITGGIK